MRDVVRIFQAGRFREVPRTVTALMNSASERRDGSISRECSLGLCRALIYLGIGLWFNDAPSRAYVATLKTRGKKGRVIAFALANRATRIA